MAVAQPEILFVFDDTSGTTITNYGSVATDATITQGTESADWQWVPGASPLLSYLESLDNQGSDMFYASATGIAMPTTLTSMWGALGFRLASYETTSTNTAQIVAQSTVGSFNGGFYVRAFAPTSTGDFNLRVGISTISGFDRNQVFEDLDFGTDYRVVFAFDATTIGASTGKYKLDAGTVTAVSGSVNAFGESWANNGGYIGRGNDFTDYRGFTGRLYYLATGRAVLLSDTDMDDINTDPEGTITGWPAGAPGGPVHPFTSVTVTG